MQELFSRLQKELNDNGPSSAALPGILSAIDSQSPAQSASARGMVDGATIAAGGQPQGTPPASDQTPWWSSKPAVAIMGILGGGGATAGVSQLSWQRIQEIPLPTVTSQWTLAGIVAVVGAIVGLAQSYYRNDWMLLMPVISRGDGKIKVVSTGFLRNMFVAALVAVSTIWMPLSSNTAAEAAAGAAATTEIKKDKTEVKATPAPSTETKKGETEVKAPPASTTETKTTETEVKSPPAPPSLLTWKTLLGAVIAGVVGSRMASGQIEKNTLMTALSKVVEAAPVPGVAQAVLDAKTPFDAVAVATGTAPPGFTPRTGSASQAADVEKELLALLDRAALQAAIAKLGKPLGPDGSGLTLSALDFFQPLKPTLKTLLGDFPIATVAGLDATAFAHEAAIRGIDADSFKALLGGLNSQAKQVMELLRSLPTTWSLPAERL